MDTQRCQNHGLVRLLVPLLEFNLRSKHEPVRITACAFVETRRHSGSEPGVSSFTVPVRDGSHATKVVSRTNWRNGILLRILARLSLLEAEIGYFWREVDRRGS